VNDIRPSNGTGLVVAALIGAAVGAGVALLLAPASGKETRGWLARKGREMKDRTMTAYEEGKDATLRAAQDLGRNIEDTAKSLDRPGYSNPGNSPIRG
jgi:gas vesicle protein